jgi:hypothetical protein
MIRLLLPLSVLLALSACGVAETGAAAATEAAAQAREIRDGKQAEARVQQQLDAALQHAADQRHTAEGLSQ